MRKLLFVLILITSCVTNDCLQQEYKFAAIKHDGTHVTLQQSYECEEDLETILLNLIDENGGYELYCSYYVKENQ